MGASKKSSAMPFIVNRLPVLALRRYIPGGFRKNALGQSASAAGREPLKPNFGWPARCPGHDLSPGRSWPPNSGLGGVMDVVVWLRGLGLEKYEAAFRENEIDETVLPSLTEEHLKQLGVTALGHRVKLLDAIAALRSGTSGAAPSVDAATPSSAPIPKTARSAVRLR